MNTKAVIFDFDDTIGNREIYSYITFCEVLDLKYPDLDPWKREAVVQHMMVYDQNGEVGRDYVRERILGKFGIDIGEDIQQYWIQHQWRNTAVYDDTDLVLHELKNRGYRLGILTNGTVEGQSGKVEKSGIADLLDAVVISGATPYKKPDPEIFLLTAEKMHMNPRECAYVGDMFLNDMYGAHCAGMRPIWYWPHGFRKVSVEIERIQCLSDLLDLFPKLEREE